MYEISIDALQNGLNFFNYNITRNKMFHFIEDLNNPTFDKLAVLFCLQQRFEKKAQAVGNIKQLWHGTRAFNVFRRYSLI